MNSSVNSPIQIIGGGLAGLITACFFPNSIVYEAGPRMQQHKALLRFRGESVSRITGIPFKAVTVEKAVYFNGQFHHDRCPINLANMYSKKVTGQFGSRSIMKLQSATRYIAPDDFYDQLVDNLGDRVKFNSPINGISGYAESPLINTAPLPVMLKMAGIEDQVKFDFNKSEIKVINIKLKTPCDVYQTVYFPGPDFITYRASITGDTLIMEMIPLGYHFSEGINFFHNEIVKVAAVFGMQLSEDLDMETAHIVDQKYGKIVDIPKEIRHGLLLQLTMDLNIYSVGRFATWRNILLDDVAEDLIEVDKLINASNYQKFHYLCKK